MRQRAKMLTSVRKRPLSGSQLAEETAAVERAAKAVKAAREAKLAKEKADKAAKAAKAKETHLMFLEGAIRNRAEQAWDAKEDNKVLMAAERLKKKTKLAEEKADKAAKAAKAKEAHLADLEGDIRAEAGAVWDAKVAKAADELTQKTKRDKRKAADELAKKTKRSTKLGMPLAEAAIKATVRLLSHLPDGKKGPVVGQIHPFIEGLIKSCTAITDDVQWDRVGTGSIIGKLALTVIIDSDDTFKDNRRRITGCIQTVLLMAFNQAKLDNKTRVTRADVDEATHQAMVHGTQVDVLLGYFQAHGCPMCGTHDYNLVTTAGHISFRRNGSQVTKLKASLNQLATCVCCCVLTKAHLDDTA